MVLPELQLLPFEPDPHRPWLWFDRQFYVAQCVERAIAPPLGSDTLYLRHYHARGAAAGLSPNPLFDEMHYRGLNPNVRPGIAAGIWASGFHHFVQIGAAAGASPIWFFDGSFYRDSNTDLAESELRRAGFSDPYSHYLLAGLAEARSGHWIVHALHQLRGKEALPTALSTLCALLWDGTQLAALVGQLFDYDWMREKYGWGDGVKPAGFLRHYLLNVREQALSPSPYFDELAYLAGASEIQANVDRGIFSSGYEHYLRFGMAEGRVPFSGFDPAYYYDNNMRIDDDGANSPQRPFIHFLRHHETRALALAPSLATMPISEDTGKSIYERRCLMSAARLGTLALDTHDGTPDVSIVMVVRNGFERTANCIISAAGFNRARVEVIVFDNGSTDETRRLQEIAPSIRVIRSEINLGFTVGANRAAAAAAGRVVVLLNNDVELAPQAIDLALRRLESDRGIGIVGAKIVRMHGRLQESGSIVWRDGTCAGYGRDRDPLDGQVSLVQDVDFCSGCFLAIRAADWHALGGFDEAFAPAYYEDTDLCLRAWERGLRVVCDPRVVVWHLEYGSSHLAEESLAAMRRNQRLFVSRHRRFLEDCLEPASGRLEAARLRHVGHPRTLFIEDMLPDANKGMGFVRAATIAHSLLDQCGLVSVLGLHERSWPTRLPRDRDGRRVELLSHVNVTNIGAFLRERVGVYDLLWLARTHNLARLAEWRRACPEFFTGMRIVLDTEAVAATRRAGYARQAGVAADLEAMVDEELSPLDAIEHICVVNELDRQAVLARLDRGGLSLPVSVLGHSLTASPLPPRFDETTDIVVVGSYIHPDGPNGDALLWFDREIRPLLPPMPGLRFVVAGADAARFVRAAGLVHEYHVVDNPSDMAPVLARARVMVASTRFAAGIPMKVHEAASWGVPVVMTELLADQLGWRVDGVQVAPAEAAAMADAIVAVALDPAVWQRSQATQLALVARDCDPAAFDQVVGQVVSGRVAARETVVATARETIVATARKTVVATAREPVVATAHETVVATARETVLATAPDGVPLGSAEGVAAPAAERTRRRHTTRNG